MKVLVGTSNWSLALRRERTLSLGEQGLIAELNELIKEVRVALIGPISQELLSGISSDEQFRILKERLHAFKDLPLTQTDYERAAEFHNACPKARIQGSQIDFLICSVSVRNKIPIFTSAKDLLHYKKELPISLYQSRNR
jgi:predicted nucleic acid-binding protein